ncbi:head-tail joining protein 1 [Streptomyces phage phiScoe25]|nr:head-tail joining protein 1 [Streptomyces phage phiScoe25]
MAYATLDDLKARLDWELDADEVRIAGGALEDASDLAAHYGRDWDEANAPRLVRTLVLKAAQRYMKNPDGYTQSRAGDETLAWNDAAGENAGTVYFSDEEIKLLRSLAGKAPGIYSAPLTAYKTKLPGGTGYSPVDYGGDPFPMFADGSV